MCAAVLSHTLMPERPGAEGGEEIEGWGWGEGRAREGDEEVDMERERENVESLYRATE